MAVAVFNTPSVKGEVVFTNTPKSLRIDATFTKLPLGEHGFHIHTAGDLRGEGCKGACDHYQKGGGEPQHHGGPPGTPGQRHTGDLGNISMENHTKTYYLRGVQIMDILGRSVIVHADPDDLGKGGKEDSLKTGHAGARIACAIIGRC